MQWTWAATILQSSNVAWQYGVSGPFWYASGATIQVTNYTETILHMLYSSLVPLLQKLVIDDSAS